MELDVKNVSFAYKAGNPLFEDISFSLKDGHIMAILGPNGSGKTTFLRCLMGMLKWSTGKVFIDGKDTGKMSSAEFFKYVGYVPQQRMAQDSFKAYDSILLGRSSQRGFFSNPKAEDFERVEEVMEMLDITQLRDRECNTLSGGEFQMVLIARALCANPKILVLDEPESGLDFKNQLIVLDTLQRLKEQGIASIFNTHYPMHALKISDYSLILDGHSGCFGATSEIINEEHIESAFGVRVAMGELVSGDISIRDIVPVEVIK